MQILTNNSELKNKVAYAFPKYAATMPSVGEILPRLLAGTIMDNLFVNRRNTDANLLELVDDRRSNIL